MKPRQVGWSARVAGLWAVATLIVLGLVTPVAGASPAPALMPMLSCHESHYRQLIGTVTTSTYLEASVPSTGTYAIEYDIRAANAAFFDTYINVIELGYVGGATGRYLTRPVGLTAGGQLVQVVGPEGSGSADVYVVSAVPVKKGNRACWR